MPRKRLKDPIYGYVEIPQEFVRIIDTAGFQRLRGILQTGYSPVYPAAVHNRFVHSIGVFHLGMIAFDSFEKSARENGSSKLKEIANDEQYWDRLKKIFGLACLLHDYGHTPFSHTCEDFLKSAGENLDGDLVKAVEDESLLKDTSPGIKRAKNHEIMSAILAIEDFKDQFKDTCEKSLFARCITGYVHKDLEKPNRNRIKLELENALIGLLNSSTIDVDKLDYLMRDSFVCGYDSVIIDYQRLLLAVRVMPLNEDPHTLQLVFDKSCISVLENVVYSRDYEKKWVQAHPVIAYEGFLIQQATSKLEKKFTQDEKPVLFSQKTLTREGVCFDNGNRIRLLSDDDIRHLMKQELDAESCYREFFDRGARRRPVWKSEADYKAFKDLISTESLEKFNQTITNMVKSTDGNPDSAVINEDTLNVFLNAKKDIEESDWDDKDSLIKRTENFLAVCEGLKKFTDDYECLEFDFAVIKGSMFQSGFEGAALGNTLIAFPNLSENDSLTCKTDPLGKIMSVLDSEPTNQNEFYYIFYRRKPEYREKFPMRAFSETIDKIGKTIKTMF